MKKKITYYTPLNLWGHCLNTLTTVFPESYVDSIKDHIIPTDQKKILKDLIHNEDILSPSQYKSDSDVYRIICNGCKKIINETKEKSWDTDDEDSEDVCETCLPYKSKCSVCEDVIYTNNLKDESKCIHSECNNYFCDYHTNSFDSDKTCYDCEYNECLDCDNLFMCIKCDNYFCSSSINTYTSKRGSDVYICDNCDH